MKRVLTGLFLIACAGGHAVEHAAPMTAQTTVASSIASTTATTPPPRALKLSIPAWEIFAGQDPSAEHAQGTLVVAVSDERGQRLDELDIATMQVFRTVDFRAAGFYALKRHGDVLYVVTTQTGVKTGATTYTLHSIDLHSLTISKSAAAVEGPARQGWDYTAPPEVVVGSRGVRVVYRGRCPAAVPEEDGTNCFFHETHRLDDLRVLKVHMTVSYTTVGHVNDPPVKVPDDYGELPEAKREDRAPLCATMAGGGSGVWVGDNYFELRRACCDDPGGGLFQCKAPPEK